MKIDMRSVFGCSRSGIFFVLGLRLETCRRIYTESWALKKSQISSGRCRAATSLACRCWSWGGAFHPPSDLAPPA